MDNRTRLLTVARILFEKTDEKHRIKSDELAEQLRKKNTLGTRRTIEEDFEALKTAGLDIQKDPFTKDYYLASRIPNVVEVSMLIECVLFSKLLSIEKTKLVIDRLMSYLSCNQQADLRKRLAISDYSGRVKSEAEDVEDTIRTIHDAILENRSISFRYFSYGPDRKEIYHYDGAAMDVSPYLTVFDNEKYYMIGYSHMHGEKRHYRIDKMRDVNIREAMREGKELLAGEKVSDYTNRHFEMFGGEEVRIQLKCKNKAANYIIDKFGKSVTILQKTDGTFIATVPVVECKLFYGWLFSMGDEIELVSPEKCVKGYTDYLKKRYEACLYKDNEN